MMRFLLEVGENKEGRTDLNATFDYCSKTALMSPSFWCFFQFILKLWALNSPGTLWGSMMAQAEERRAVGRWSGTWEKQI